MGIFPEETDHLGGCTMKYGKLLPLNIVIYLTIVAIRENPVISCGCLIA